MREVLQSNEWGRRAGARCAATALLLILSLIALSARAEPDAGVGAVFTLEKRYLHAAGEGDESSVARALDLGADPHAVDGLGRNALLLAARGKGSPGLVRLLAGRGVAADRADAGGMTALAFAAARGDADLVGVLLDLGADVHRTDDRRRAALYHAASRDRREVVTLLLSRGAMIDRADDFGDTPLIAACARGHDAMAQLLLAQGADPTLRDREGRSAAERSAPEAVSCRGNEEAEAH